MNDISDFGAAFLIAAFALFATVMVWMERSLR